VLAVGVCRGAVELQCWKDVKCQKRSLLEKPLLQGPEEICGDDDGWLGERDNISAPRETVWSIRGWCI